MQENDENLATYLMILKNTLSKTKNLKAMRTVDSSREQHRTEIFSKKAVFDNGLIVTAGSLLTQESNECRLHRIQTSDSISGRRV